MSNISALIGKTCTRVAKVDDDRIEFDCESGERYAIYHSQDCCEHVVIESIVGDLDFLVGAQILMADESSNDKTHPAGYTPDYEPESFTWTFYKFGTIKGYVDVRFLGTSNGYYGERAHFEQIGN